MNSIPSKLQKKLADYNQAHLLTFWNELNDAEQQELDTQLKTIDFDQFVTLKAKSSEVTTKKVEPCATIPLDESNFDLGVRAIKNGEIGVLTVAGGQGTRLGWSGPKGTYPATPITGKSLFQVIAEQIVFASQKYNTTIPWYIMTSNQNDAITRAFLLDNNCFGLERTDIFLFTQGEVPAVDCDGNMLLATKSEVAMNPDGHGGVVAALQRSGGLEEMATRGIQHLSYVQIDNPLAQVIDPSFIGLHLSDRSSREASSKCVLKTDPDEKVGVFCTVNGNVEVVEYSDLPSEKATERGDNGALLYGGGSIALHLFSVEFLQQAAQRMQWHKANKKVSYVDVQTGEKIEPDSPNAFKYEKFVFDVLPFAKGTLVIETSREDEFAPIKNASGQDSSETSHLLQQNRAKRWLEAQGVEVSPQSTVEISPLTASCAMDLQEVNLPRAIGEDEIVAL
ncbi:MAG: UDPGP type 1 family protein [Planctomycetes bacterium]|nr:UDPGP type 1 family protein [Planctomycetota bacterium]